MALNSESQLYLLPVLGLKVCCHVQTQPLDMDVKVAAAVMLGRCSPHPSPSLCLQRWPQLAKGAAHPSLSPCSFTPGPCGTNQAHSFSMSKIVLGTNQLPHFGAVCKLWARKQVISSGVQVPQRGTHTCHFASVVALLSVTATEGGQSFRTTPADPVHPAAYVNSVLGNWPREILALLQPVLSGLGQPLSLTEPFLSGWQG